MTTPDELLAFWIDEVGPKGWYSGAAELDRACAERFGAAQEALRRGAYRDWLANPEGALAYLILADQLSRNIHRGKAAAFACDMLAQEGARHALAHFHDTLFSRAERQFFYMPFMHAESRQIQEQSVGLFLTRMPGTDNLLHARAHRDIIRRFGRFPFRNAALGRRSNAAEQAFLADEGYGGVVTALKEE